VHHLGEKGLSRTRILLILSVCGLVIAGTLFVLYRKNSQARVVIAKQGSIVEAIYGIGTVESRREFNFKVGLTKTVQRLFVSEGQAVAQGQILVELSDGVLVRSPFAGTVVSLPFNVGENVFPDVPVVSVQDLKDYFISATLEQQGALRVQKGMPLTLSFESIRDQKFSGKVVSLYPQKGQFVVKIEPTQTLPSTILPGMTADVAIEIAQRDQVLLVPFLAVSQGQLVRKRNGDTKKVSVRIGSTDQEWAEVLDGDVQAGDEILMRR
jgi:macrolide-specific efflux system membrane fusion protein